MSEPLYERASALTEVIELLIEAGGELTPELEERLDKADDAFDRKAEHVALKILELKRSAEAARAESNRLAARARARERSADSLGEYLRMQMERVGRTVVEGELATIRVQNSPLSVVCSIPEAELAKYFDSPEYSAFIRVEPAKYRFNAKAALEAVRAGAELPAGIATERRTHIRFY